MINDNLLRRAAKNIPWEIRKLIHEKNTVDQAQNVDVTGGPMEFLYDVYIEFIDSNDVGEFSCHKCRNTILQFFYKIKPFLNIENL